MQRRDFLKISGLTSLGLMLPTMSPWERALAAVAPGKHLIIFRFEGGWDVAAGTEAIIRPAGLEEGDIYLDYSADELITSGNLRFGPSFAALKPWLDRAAAVNGIFMSGNNVDHTANLAYMVSGDTSGKQADFSVEFANAEQRLLGVISQNTIRSMERKVSITSLSSLNSLSADSVSPDLLGSSLPPTAFGRSLQEFQRQREPLAKLQTEIQAIKGDLSSNERDAASVAAVFRSGLSRVAEIGAGGSLDSHSNYAGSHKAELQKGAERLAAFLSVFQKTPFGEGGESLLDRTLFVAVSEFSRTPALNGSQGKDHNPLTNSALLIGHGIRGGEVWGQSRVIPRQAGGAVDSKHVATMVDADGRPALTREQASSGAFSFVRPGHVLSTALEILGVPAGAAPSIDRKKTAPIRRVMKG